jgi:hypothetical protein
MGYPFPEEVAPGGVLVYPQIQSPNYISGVSGWSIMSNGSAQFNQLTLIVQSSGAAVLIYAGAAASGSLIGSWASASGTDQYGNTYPAGISANQGFLSGLTIQNASIIGSTIASAVISGPSITAAAITGGTISETAITFDQTGGTLLVYSSTTTTVTITSGTSWTAPAGSYNQGKIECWGASAGGGGGNAGEGGETGGGGEYACEPNYTLIPGGIYNTAIGLGGTGGTSGNAGNPGGQTAFDNQGVVANGGVNGLSFLSGAGGTGSTNTIHFNGGNGANASGNNGGSSGGNSANATGAGNNGIASSGNTGAAAPAAQTGSGRGGAGGSNAANGSNGGAPGGAGGGAGAGSSSTQGSNTYRMGSSATYYGSDGSSPNGKRANGTMYQGGETSGGGSFNGTMKSLMIISGNPSSDLSGKTIDSVSLRLDNLHSWYNNGLYVNLGYTSKSSLPGSWDGTGITSVKQYWQNQGSTTTTDLTNLGLGSALQSGAANSLSLGPGSPAFDLYNYGYFYGAGGSSGSNPLLTVQWHTGTAPTQAGSGANGQIKITYTSAFTLIGAIAPVAGSDASSNAYGAGYTGVVQAFQPSVSPTAVEVWHNVTPPTNWSGTCRYKLLAEHNMVMVDFTLTATSQTSNVVVMTLPLIYRPTIDHYFPLAITSNTAPTAQNCRCWVNTDGTVNTFGLPTATTGIFATLIVPLD